MTEQMQDSNFRKFVLGNWLPTEKGIMDIFGSETQIITDQGEIKDYPLPLETKGLYFYLTSRLGWYDDELDTWPSYEYLEKATTWKRKKLEKHLKILEDIGLIKKIKRPGKSNLYQIKTLQESRIYYNRKKEDGTYYHQEIKTSIEIIEGALQDIRKATDPFIMMIMDAFKITAIEPIEQNQLKTIKESNFWTQGELIDYAENIAKQKKSIHDFIDQLDRQIKEKHVRLLEPIPLFNWLDRDNNQKKEQKIK